MFMLIKVSLMLYALSKSFEYYFHAKYKYYFIYMTSSHAMHLPIYM
jgi:hypothetical protein